MDVKTKNWLTVALLSILALGIYVYALPTEVIEAVGKALKRIINGG